MDKVRAGCVGAVALGATMRQCLNSGADLVKTAYRDIGPAGRGLAGADRIHSLHEPVLCQVGEISKTIGLDGTIDRDAVHGDMDAIAA